jgi:serine/threonine protein kinase
MADPTRLGPYEIVGLARRGRSADSYLARHARMKAQQVLLRVLHDDVALDEAFVREFVTQARSAARLQHDCIARVIDLESESRPVYTVLEYIEGVDLGGLREAYGSPPPEIAAAILAEVSRGLEYAHAESVLHRRLRPRLVKVAPNGRVKILGFGISEQQGLVQPTVNIADVEHEEFFRSPEQIAEQAETRATDLFSVGVIFFELLTGQMPYPDFSGFVSAEPASLAPLGVRELDVLVPRELAELLERLLAGRPGDRPADAGAVRRAAEAVVEAAGYSAGPELLRAYLEDAAKFAAESRRRRIDDLMEELEKRAKGSRSERDVALDELERLLVIEPDHRAARALASRLRTQKSLEPPPEPARSEVLETRIMPPRVEKRADPPEARIVDPPKAPEPRPRAQPRRRAPSERRLPAWLVIAGAIVVAAGVGLGVRMGCREPADHVAATAPAPRGTTSPPAPAPPPKPAAGTVNVRSKPKGAIATLVDGDISHVTDTTFTDVSAGTQRWHVELDGYRSRDTTIDVEAGMTSELFVELASSMAPVAPCSLYVSVKPRADQVLVDDLLATGGPVDFWTKVSRRGKHVLSVSATHYVTYTNPVIVENLSVPRHLRVTLNADPADPPPAPQPAPPPTPTGIPMKLEVNPACDVYVDGTKVEGPVTSAELHLAPGTRKVRIVNPDYATVEREIHVQIGRSLRPLHVNLKDGSRGLFIDGPRGLQIIIDNVPAGLTTPDRKVLSAGPHDIKLLRADGSYAGPMHVVIDPSQSGDQHLIFPK